MQQQVESKNFYLLSLYHECLDFEILNCICQKTAIGTPDSRYTCCNLIFTAECYRAPLLLHEVADAQYSQLTEKIPKVAKRKPENSQLSQVRFSIQVQLGS